MASLALVVTIIMLSVWASALFSLLFSFLGFRRVGAAFGVLSVVAGVWLLFTLPHVPILGAINLIAGLVAIQRLRKEKK